MDELLQMGKDVLASQPFSGLVGADLTVLAPGHAELCIPITPQLKQQHGFMHGGVISYAAYNALTYVGATVLGPAVVTSEYKINYLRPAIGETLMPRATVVYSSKTQAVCRADIIVVSEGKEVLCAVAQGTIARIGQSADDRV